MNIELKHEITIADYNNLRRQVGWKVLEEKQAQTGLDHTYYLVTATDNGKTVGMTRVVSDGGYIAIIVDVIVLPEYQGKGIGRLLMEDVMTYIRENLGRNELRVMINLMAAKGKEGFYEKFGFIQRPNEEMGAGMVVYLN